MINAPTCPMIKWALKNNLFSDAETILDFGAGRGRHADHLRRLGYKVFAYDPYHYNKLNGYEYGGISSQIPSVKFDVCISSFVLNVVPRYIEKRILAIVERRASKRVLHITRNMDILTYVHDALADGNPHISRFYRDVYKGPKNPNVAQVLNFCKYGVRMDS